VAYFEAIPRLFPDDTAMVCNAQYEIGHAYYKQGKYEEARTELNTLVARYNSDEGSSLPIQFKTLALTVLGLIDEKIGPAQ
jgi:hypothetical protein